MAKINFPGCEPDLFLGYEQTYRFMARSAKPNGKEGLIGSARSTRPSSTRSTGRYALSGRI